MPISDWQPRNAEIGISPAFAVFPVQDLQAAIAFYQRLGFVPTGELDENGEVIVRLALPSA